MYLLRRTNLRFASKGVGDSEGLGDFGSYIVRIVARTINWEKLSSRDQWIKYLMIDRHRNSDQCHSTPYHSKVDAE